MVERQNPASARTIDAAEVARFDRLAATWWDQAGPMRTLHRFNPPRLTFIRDQIAMHWDRDPKGGRPLHDLAILDVGCAGGLLCEPLARMGADVTGIDPATTNIEVARLHAAQSGLAVSYRPTPIEEIAASDERFDVVLAMEVVEHVADVDAFVAACCAAVKPDGLLFMATLNRTLKSFALAIVGAEYVLNWLPHGTHDWNKFLTPAELSDFVLDNQFGVIARQGVVYQPLRDRWVLSTDMDVNYMIVAARR
jgi:2-polyprenyl-6-hydroxyphenyl methylase/3-demethylubiquinone-9 3-methyltransferase